MGYNTVTLRGNSRKDSPAYVMPHIPISINAVFDHSIVLLGAMGLNEGV